MSDASTASATAQYHAKFALDPSGQWLAEIEELPAVHTFGRTLGKAREYLVDALALWLDVPTEAVRERIQFQSPSLPKEIEQFVERAKAEREIAESAAQLAQTQISQAALTLVEGARLSLRDAADVLGMSHQRVQQLIAAARREQSKPVSVATVPEDLLSTLRDYLPGGTKEDLGRLVAVALLGLSIAWLEGRRG